VVDSLSFKSFTVTWQVALILESLVNDTVIVIGLVVSAIAVTEHVNVLLAGVIETNWFVVSLDDQVKVSSAAPLVIVATTVAVLLVALCMLSVRVVWLSLMDFVFGGGGSTCGSDGLSLASFGQPIIDNMAINSAIVIIMNVFFILSFLIILDINLHYGGIKTFIGTNRPHRLVKLLVSASSY
jgi:hypothetical protein